MKVQRAEYPATLAGHEAARRFFASCFSPTAPRRQLWVAHLDEQARVLELDRHRGDGSMAVPEILADAARLGSAGVILARQEDEARCPSTDDVARARSIAVAGEPLDLILVDHLAFDAAGSCRSFRRLGLI